MAVEHQRETPLVPRAVLAMKGDPERKVHEIP
jgi:hypothetical protein